MEPSAAGEPAPAADPGTDMDNYPFLTPEEFRTACRHFVARHGRFSSHSSAGWVAAVALHQSNDKSSIQIVRQLGANESATRQSTSNEDGVEVEEVEDHEALPADLRIRKTLDVVYEIALSPVYQVPVLYIGFRYCNGSTLMADLDQAYAQLVPDVHKPALTQVGVIGGLSYGEHFLTGAPALFVHPCNTSNAMRELRKGLGVTLDTYLDVWLGIIGAPLGLSLPTQTVSV